MKIFKGTSDLNIEENNYFSSLLYFQSIDALPKKTTYYYNKTYFI